MVTPVGAQYADLVEQHLIEDLSERIRQGVLRPGQAIPSQAALAREYGVSRERVRKVIAKLGESGLVETVRGCGSFVRQGA
jgi:GntR family transcriptional regulator, transcriptional repressor for pyruvate dehydrogenase complex